MADTAAELVVDVTARESVTAVLTRLEAQLGQTNSVAERLAALYEYISLRLLWANLKNDVAALDEAAQLLGELQSAWGQIDETRKDAA